MSNLTSQSKNRAKELVDRYVPLGTKTDRAKLAKATAARLDGQPYQKALSTGQYSNKKMVMAMIRNASMEDAEVILLSFSLASFGTF